MAERPPARRAAAWLAAALAPVALLSLSLEWTLRTDWPAAFALEAGRAGAPPPALTRLHERVHAFHFQGDSLAGTPLGTAERVHLAEVRTWLDANRRLGYAALAAALVAVWASRRPRAALGRGGRATLGVLTGLGLAALHPVLAFRGLHPLVFPGGGWDFDPTGDALVQLYTRAALGVYAAAALGTAVLAAAALALAARPGRGQWRRRDGLWLIPGLLGAYPAWLAGHAMRVPADPAWWLLYALAALLPAAAVALWLDPRRLRGAALAAAAVVLWQGYAMGVGAARDAAVAAAIDQGPTLIRAIERYRLTRERLPARLSDLVSEQLDVPPRPLPGVDWWYRPLPGGRHYRLGFPGPMAFHVSYHSASGRWNLPPEP